MGGSLDGETPSSQTTLHHFDPPKVFSCGPPRRGRYFAHQLGLVSDTLVDALIPCLIAYSLRSPMLLGWAEENVSH